MNADNWYWIYTIYFWLMNWYYHIILPYHTYMPNTVKWYSELRKTTPTGSFWVQPAVHLPSQNQRHAQGILLWEGVFRGRWPGFLMPNSLETNKRSGSVVFEFSFSGLKHFEAETLAESGGIDSSFVQLNGSPIKTWFQDDLHDLHVGWFFTGPSKSNVEISTNWGFVDVRYFLLQGDIFQVQFSPWRARDLLVRSQD